jgi:predicted MFS family arabinose efflux permease
MSSPDAQADPSAPAPRRASTLSPLRHKIFMAIWIASLVSNLGGLIQGVGAGWLMTSIAPSADMVALVQSSTTLPILLLALLSGAVADTYDRRLVMLVAQTVMLAVSAALAVLSYLHMITPWTLLSLTFLLGCGTALHAPSWQASVGEQVPREDLAGAVALNSLSFNIARTLGPAIGGVVVAAAGPSATFLLNAVSYIGLIAVLALWRPPPAPAGYPREALGSAMGAGLRYARMSPVIRTVLIRGMAFGLAGSAVWALMPLVARDALHGGAGAYGLILSAFGGGAVVGALNSSWLRQRFAVETLVRAMMGLFGLAVILVAFSHLLPLTMLALFLAGGAWVLTLSSLNITIQMAAPRWVVGRSMSLFQMATFGGMALGSWSWGRLAETTGLTVAVGLSGAAVLVAILMGLRWRLPNVQAIDHTPLRTSSDPEAGFALEPRSGPVVLTVEYRVAPDQARAFMAAMREKRRIRQRDGAQRWSLAQDMTDHEVWVERFQTPTWLDHLRLRRRVTIADQGIEQQVRAFHIGSEPPKVRRLLERPLVGAPAGAAGLEAPMPVSGGDPTLPQGALR